MSNQIIQIKDGSDNILPLNNESRNGYCKMPDGTLICYGQSGGYASGNNRTDEITFASAFATTDYYVTANGWYSGTDTTNYNVTCIINRVSTTKCKINVHNPTANYTNVIFWIAIGRWKA